MMRMQIFGGFVLYGKQAILDEKMLHSNKLVRLLVYILLHRQRDLTHQELIDVFWEGDGSRNPDGALKNLIYRLRTELKVFGEGDLILTLPGAYRWNPDTPVEADYETLEEAAKRARKATDADRQQELCERMISLYRSDVSPRIAKESWMLSRLTYYRLLYLETVKCLAEIYWRKEAWDALEQLCQKALDVDTLDEDLYYWLIKSQIGKKDYDQAMTYYENANKQLYDHLGIRNADRFEGIYEEILALSDRTASNINSLMESVCEKEKPTGVFACEYPIFREIYRVEARRIRRTGIAEYILLITVRKSGKASVDAKEESIKEGMQFLGQQLNVLLRTGDVVARYSSNQYAVLLPTCTYESALVVSDRIEKSFRSVMGRKRLSLQFEVEEVQMVAE